MTKVKSNYEYARRLDFKKRTQKENIVHTSTLIVAIYNNMNTYKKKSVQSIFIV